MNVLTKSWLLGIALVVAGEITVATLLPEGWQTRTARDRMESQLGLPKADIAILGASGAAAAIDPELFAYHLPEQARHLTVANYALPGSSTLYLKPQLQRLIAASKAPGLIVFAPHPANLGSAEPAKFVGRFASQTEVAELVTRDPAPRPLFHGLTSRLSYSFRYRDELRSLLTQGDLRHLRTMTLPVSPQAAPVTGLDAEIHLPPREPTESSFRQIGRALSRPFAVDPSAARGVEAFLALAKEHNIPVFWVHLPTCESLAALPHHEKSVGEYLAFADSFEKRGLVQYVGHDIQVMPDRWFTDPWHLGVYGAQRYSTQLAENLSRLSDFLNTFEDAVTPP